MNEKRKEIIVKNDDTLISILSNNLQDLSLKTIKNYVRHKMCEINGVTETNYNKIIKKDSIIVLYFSERIINNYNIDIIYEDKDLIAINKPSGLLSISNSKEKNITAFRMVSDYIKKDNPKAKLFVIHRLDQDTSGVLIFSKNLKLKEKMQKSWNEIVKKREYICVVRGKTPQSGQIESYLTMNHFQIVHSTKNKEIGKLAITNYEMIKYKKPYSLLKVNIETGRRNQIRAHLSEMGYPIVGDKKYGSKVNPIGRLALHATELDLIDIRNGKILKIKTKIPEEIEKIVS